MRPALPDLLWPQETSWPHTVRLVGLLALVIGLALLASALTVTPVASAADPEPTGEHAPALTGQAEDADALSAEIRTDRTILTNVSQTYVVETSGATGNVTAVWDFEGETKHGTRVEHEFTQEGNATIDVTVTDESGASVTASTTVEVVDLQDDEESKPLKAISTIGLIFVLIVIVPLLLKVVVLPIAMMLLEDAL